MIEVHIGGERYVSGLFWQTLDTQNTRAAARHLADEVNRGLADSGSDEHYTLMVRRTGAYPQVGFASGTNLTLRLPSIAALVADGIGGTFRARFRLGAGVLLVAANEGMILADGGDLYINEEQAAEEWARLDTLLEWEQTQSYDEETESLRALGTLVEHVRKPVKTESIHPKILTFKVVAAIVVILVVIVFVIGWHTHNHYLAKLRARAVAIATAREAIAAQTAAAKRAAEAQAERRSGPEASALFGACAQLLTHTAPTAAGWRLHEWTCNAKGATLEWHWNASVSFTELPPGAVFNLNNPRIVHSHVAFPSALSVQPAETALPRQTAVAQLLYAVGARLDSNKISIRWARRSRQTASSSKPEHHPAIVQGAFTIGVPTAPLTSGAVFDGLAGIRVRELIDTSIDTSPVWRIKGDIYAVP